MEPAYIFLLISIHQKLNKAKIFISYTTVSFWAENVSQFNGNAFSVLLYYAL